MHSLNGEEMRSAPCMACLWRENQLTPVAIPKYCVSTSPTQSWWPLSFVRPLPNRHQIAIDPNAEAWRMHSGKSLSRLDSWKESSQRKTVIGCPRSRGLISLLWLATVHNWANQYSVCSLRKVNSSRWLNAIVCLSQVRVIRLPAANRSTRLVIMDSPKNQSMEDLRQTMDLVCDCDLTPPLSEGGHRAQSTSIPTPTPRGGEECTFPERATRPASLQVRLIQKFIPNSTKRNVFEKTK